MSDCDPDKPWTYDDLPEDVRLQRIVAEAIAGGTSLPRWGWAVPGPYNGYTGAERIRGWQIVRIALRMGLIRQPSSCSVCARTGHIHYHSELYGRPLLSMPICKSCHFAVHRRVRSPMEWCAFLNQHDDCDWVHRIPVAGLIRTEALALERLASPFGLTIKP